MEIYKCDETEAKKELERIAQDNQITGQDIDWTDMGEEGDGRDVDDADRRGEEDDVEDEHSGEPASGGTNR